MPSENAYFIVERAGGSRCLGEIGRTLDSLPGVASVNIDLQNHLVAIDYDSSGTSYDRIEHCLNRLGYEITADASEIHTR